jgi:hypothetical protein
VTEDHNQNAYAPPASNGLAIASLVVGIVALLLAFIPIVGMISWILAPAGLIMGLMSMNKGTGRGLAIGGAVVSGIALLICILWVVGFAGLAAIGGSSGY